MNYYKVQFSYIRSGKRVYEYDEITASRAADAAEEVRRYYNDLEGLRIEQVWIDTGAAWEVREFDY
ncbi:MAG: hypothetical protein IJV30_02260 [Oscillospiraceae bacterium]|nr:hypothetical protein [Oscillospiraceae bacterium]